jgi:hypothetical protein
MARSEGEPLVGEDILLHLAEVRFVNTKSLIPEKERNRHSWGGMSFSYFGGFMESWSQLTLHGIDGGAAPTSCSRCSAAVPNANCH